MKPPASLHLNVTTKTSIISKIVLRLKFPHILFYRVSSFGVSSLLLRPAFPLGKIPEFISRAGIAKVTHVSRRVTAAL